jgi:hypothetical protein
MGWHPFCCLSPSSGEMGGAVSMHYHLKLYHLSRCLQDVEQVQDQPAAMARARQLTEHVQDCLRAKTYRVRAEPCTLLHFPERAPARRRYP